MVSIPVEFLEASSLEGRKKLVTAGKRQSWRGHPAGLQEGLPEGSRSREAGVLQREPCAHGRRRSEQGFGDLKGLPEASSDDFHREPPCTRLLVPSPAGGDAVFLSNPAHCPVALFPFAFSFL